MQRSTATFLNKEAIAVINIDTAFSVLSTMLLGICRNFRGGGSTVGVLIITKHRTIGKYFLIRIYSYEHINDKIYYKVFSSEILVLDSPFALEAIIR